MIKRLLILLSVIISITVFASCRKPDGLGLSAVLLKDSSGNEKSVASLDGEIKLLIFFPDEGDLKIDQAVRLSSIFSDTVVIVPVFFERIASETEQKFLNFGVTPYLSEDKDLFKKEANIFLTDKDGNTLYTLGSSYAGAASELAKLIDTETLRKKVMSMLIGENLDELSDGDVLLIVYKPTCSLCRETLDKVYNERNELKEKYKVITLVTAEDETHPELGHEEIVDTSGIYLKSLKEEDNIGFFLIRNGEYINSPLLSELIGE